MPENEKRYLELAEEILKYFECKGCGWCCKNLGVGIEKGDIERLPVEPKNTRVILTEDNVIEYIKPPCEYLDENNSCSIYDHRLKECRFFPFTIRGMRLNLCPLGKEISDLYEMVADEKFFPNPERLEKFLKHLRSGDLKNVYFFKISKQSKR